ncbi:MAG: 50S ribosomal protein L25, partial [Novosphingobium sp.]
IHISHVKLPEGAESAITDRDFTIATIVAPSALKRAEGAAAAAGDAGEEAESESDAGEE